ncbi:hypothetical protein E4184_10960 [Aeromonas media]|uniref:Uncharacterized protein n=1 Tax=Aeromonas media TaxID=651 RepID=A0A6M4YA68_AERME|nr:hypothetical protein E4184_10960 [Aeromonas media]
MTLRYPAWPGIFSQNVCLALNKMDNHQNKFYTRAVNSTKIDLFQLFLGRKPLHCGYLVPWPL